LTTGAPEGFLPDTNGFGAKALNHSPPRRVPMSAAYFTAPGRGERARKRKPSFGADARMLPVQFVQRLGVVEVVVEAVTQRTLL